VLIRRLQDEFDLEVNIGKPQVVYRETILAKAEKSGTFEQDIAGKSQFAAATLVLRPAANGAGIRFASALADDAALPPEIVEAVNQGVRAAASSGVVQGYPVVDVEVTLARATYRPEDSTPLAFSILATQLFRQGLEAAQPVLLEPLMRLEVLVPEEFVGGVIGGLQTRRGVIEGVESQGRVQEISTLVPLAAMFGYTTDLRSASQGRGTFTMQFARYAPVP
jgi:elongation factor G